MEGAHDLGGTAGFGAVRTADGDLTHVEDWELRAQWLALAACRGARPWVERIDPPVYLSTPYYGRWLIAAEMGAVAHGTVTAEELAAMQARIAAGDVPSPVLDPDLTARVERNMTTPEPMQPATDPVFGIGDRVIPKRMYEPDVHHRCPRYVRGVVGTIERICGDERLAGWRGFEVIEPLYTVRFESDDLFGPRPSEPPYALFIDLWQSYLDPAGPPEPTERR